MKKTVLSFLLFAFAFSVKAQRNVILIIADDVGTDYFGCYENHGDTASLPNISSLLSKGIRFQNAMSNPVCSATRAGMLTGRYSFRTGVGGIVGGAGGSGTLDTAEVTIPRLLNIYNPNIGKAQIGKWHLNQAMPSANLLIPNKMGFQHFEGPFIGAITSYTNWTKYTNGVMSTVTTYATTEGVNNAISWIKTQNNNPFFLWLAFNAPHEPLHLPPAGFYTNTTLTGTQQNINTHRKEYLIADLEALDHEIGRMFDSLQVLNLLDSTDFIFMGDNGNTPLTAQNVDTSRAKGTIYQYGVHEPFIIAGPSVINPGRVSDALVNTADVFATVNELMGNMNWQAQIPANKPVDSKSILPVILNQSTTIRPWAFTEIFSITPSVNNGKAIRNMDYKLLSFDDGHQEFYNLSIDTNELNDLLLGSLNATEISNYNYLCNELSTLVGTGNFCTTSAGVNNISKEDFSVYPNPFTSHIDITSKSESDVFELSDCLGQVIYSGKNIDQQNFYSLPKGVYFLKNKSSIYIIKLIKL